jgi:hypothetical protein
MRVDPKSFKNAFPRTPDCNVENQDVDWQYLFRYTRPRFVCLQTHFNIAIGGAGDQHH